MRRLLSLAVVALLARETSAIGFTPGDLFADTYYGTVYNVTAGGNFASATPFASVGFIDIGKPAWSADLSTMYVSDRVADTVYAIDAAGNVSTFATGLDGPAGLLLTSTGKLLVTEFDAGEVTDISAGGNFTSAAPFAAGMSNPGDLAETPDGRLFASEWGAHEVSNITAGGTITPGDVFVSGLPAVSSLITSQSGGLMATASNAYQVYDITPLGVKTLFGSNAAIWGIGYDASGNLLGADLSTNEVRNISAGGDLSTAPVFASGLSGLHSVAVVPVPEPVAALAAAGMALIPIVRRRRI
jgi:hypothetical protein